MFVSLQCSISPVRRSVTLPHVVQFSVALSVRGFNTRSLGTISSAQQVSITKEPMLQDNDNYSETSIDQEQLKAFTNERRKLYQ